MKRNNSTGLSAPFVKHIIFAFLITCLCNIGIRAQSTRPGIFYAITGNNLKDTSYLFGTYHLVKQEFVNDKKAVKEAYTKSKGVVVEIVMDSASMGKIQTAGTLTDNTLSGLLEKSLLDSLDAELQASLGMGVDRVNHLSPMSITLTLSMVYTLISNQALFEQYKGETLDVYFAKNGTVMGKKVTALETVDQQMDLLYNSQSLKDQVKGLRSFLSNKNEMNRLGDELVKNWFANDMEKIVEVYNNTLKLSGEEDRMVKERNLNWMKVLPALIKKQSQFIAVGALHLGGEYGLVNLLQQSGYTVKPVKL